MFRACIVFCPLQGSYGQLYGRRGRGGKFHVRETVHAPVPQSGAVIRVMTCCSIREKFERSSGEEQRSPLEKISLDPTLVQSAIFGFSAPVEPMIRFSYPYSSGARKLHAAGRDDEWQDIWYILGLPREL